MYHREISVITTAAQTYIFIWHLVSEDGAVILSGMDEEAFYQDCILMFDFDATAYADHYNY